MDLDGLTGIVRARRVILAGPAKERRQKNLVELKEYQQDRGSESTMGAGRAIPLQGVARGIRPSSSRLMAEKFAVAAELRG